MKNTPSPPESPTFESAMERLENIVEKMESAQMPLDELLVSYEEGNHLIGLCQEKLLAAEQRIEMVSRKASEAIPAIKNPLKTTAKPDPDVSLF